ncbi:glycosyltransferase family 39 protein [Planctomicrobium piriforme]|uniref:Dolichyl-phosphate-mannose-protein mannosyltransferase n=1 Tax=Planctomicrobium piriforme TaxID=1576369 RepID=A0A1I3ARL9_9PLAN|nr:glycosyltransferase family 39 protein [Planctomicrobium piriforme]SFH52652.1 Dolichyl-phosphate-mannose-protein mannosyltransferase [Planctomicrobium piriforme]
MSRTTRSTALFLLTLGLGTLFLVAGWLTPFETVRAQLDPLSGDGTADRYTPELHRRLQFAALTCGLLMSATAVAIRVLAPRLSGRVHGLLRRLVVDVRTLRVEITDTFRANAVVLIGLTIAAAGLRACFLDLPMRYDEAHSWLEYASFPSYVIVAKYDDPNNHIFHNLLTHLASLVCGSDPWALRLPAFMAGVLLVPATYLLGTAFCDRRVGGFAALLALASSPLIDYSVNSRGYALLCLLTVLAWLAALHWRQTRNLAAALCLIACGVLGLWTVPTMLYSLLSIWAWLGWSAFRTKNDYGSEPDRSNWRGVAAIILLTAMGACVVYAPVLLLNAPADRILGESSGRAERLNPMMEVASMFQGAASLLWRDVPLPLIGFFIAMIAAALVLPNPCRTDLRRVAIALALPFLLTGVLGIIPPPRSWLYMIPWLGVLTAAGTVSWLSWISIRRQSMVLGMVEVTTMFVLVTILIARQPIRNSNETGVFPAAHQIILELKSELTPPLRIVAVSPASSPLVYYARREGLPDSLFAWPQSGDRIIIATAPGQTPADILHQLNMQISAAEFHAMRIEPAFTLWERNPKAGAPE